MLMEVRRFEVNYVKSHGLFAKSHDAAAISYGQKASSYGPFIMQSTHFISFTRCAPLRRASLILLQCWH